MSRRARASRPYRAPIIDRLGRGLQPSARSDAHLGPGTTSRVRQQWPEARARVEAEAAQLSKELHLSQLRKARGLTQQTMAELLGVSQAEVSKLEPARTELYVGTLENSSKR